jgi:hypothetical protein
VITELASAIRQDFDRVAKKFKKTDKRMRERDRRMRATDKRIDKLMIAKQGTDNNLDERVDQLVFAIREFIRQQNTSKRKGTRPLARPT